MKSLTGRLRKSGRSPSLRVFQPNRRILSLGRIRFALAFVALLAAPPTASASSLTYSGLFTNPILQIGFNLNGVDGILSNAQVPIIASQTGLQMEVDPEGLTLSYDLVQFQASASAFTFNEDLACGLGCSADYSIAFDFDAITVGLTSASVNPLLPVGGDSYTAGPAPVAAVGANMLAGTWSVTGPDSTVTGSFDQPIDSPWRGSLNEALLNTSGYPGSLVMSFPYNGQELTEFQQSLPLINTIVDGAEIDVSTTIIVPIASGVTLAPGSLDANAPEPSAWILFAGGLIVIGGICRMREACHCSLNSHGVRREQRACSSRRAIENELRAHLNFRRIQVSRRT